MNELREEIELPARPKWFTHDLEGPRSFRPTRIYRASEAQPFMDALEKALELAKSELKSSLATNREQKATLADRDNHIDLAYKALGDVNRSVYLFDHIREQKAEIERLTADAKMWKFMVEDSAEHQLAVSEGSLHARQGKPMNPSYSASGKLTYSYQCAYEDVQSRIAAESELASLRASVGEKWIDVKQELPPYETPVLVSVLSMPARWRFSIVSQLWKSDIWHNVMRENYVTHWQPIVAPTLPG